MTPFAKLVRLIHRLRHSHSFSTRDPWSDVIKTLPVGHDHDQSHSGQPITQAASQCNESRRRTNSEHQYQVDSLSRAQSSSQTGSQTNAQSTTKSDAQSKTQPVNTTDNKRPRQHRSDDVFDDRRVPRDPTAVQQTWLRIVKNNNNITTSQAALALLFELTLKQAVEIIEALPKTAPTLINLEIEQSAFLRICSHLEQQNFAQQPAQCLSILTLLARRLGHLNDHAQRDVAINLLAQSLRILPQIEVIETLSTELTNMPPALQQRALDQIEEFLWRTADIALSHVDILQGLTRAVRIESCRQRAGALIAAGLKRLRNEPELCAQIRRNLVLAYCTDEQTMQLQA